MSKCTLFFSRCICAIALALLSSIFAQASELDSVRTLNLDPNLVWDKISPSDYELSEDSLTLVRWTNKSTLNLNMEQDSRLSKVQFIGDGAFFSDSVSLETVVLASSVKSIGDGAFSNCSRLTSVVLPSSLTRIERESFLGCYNLKSIVIPSSVETIEDGAFSYCLSLTSVVIPESITSIGDNIFAYSNKIEQIIIPASVKRIGNSAFRGCNGLKYLLIPTSVTSIGNWAFADCSGLIDCTIPSSVTSIGKDAFSSSFSDVLLNLRFESPKPPYVDKFIASEYSKIRIIVPKGAREAYIKANLVANAECIVEE